MGVFVRREVSLFCTKEREEKKKKKGAKREINKMMMIYTSYITMHMYGYYNKSGNIYNFKMIDMENFWIKCIKLVAFCIL